MFQSFALFPHMNVANNVMFELKMRGYSKPDRIQRMREVLELVELSEFEDRHISTLSGGQQQRVALARSIAPNPRLLMLDEPLGSLDVTLSRRLVVELRQIIKKVGLTAVYVTHHQQEAFSIGDRVAIMNEGRIEQIGSGQDIYRKPKTIFTAKFLGLTNILPIERFDDDMAHTLAGRFVVDRNAEALLIHPDGVQMVNANAPHMLSGEVSEVEFQGDVFKIQIQVAPDVNFLLSVPSRGVEVPRVGQEVALGFSGESVIPLYG
jgi:ABC-type Fe3+/spermidine/putrescine transport system ATPase subunit